MVLYSDHRKCQHHSKLLDKDPPHSGGFSPKMEFIVESGKTLTMESGATLKASTPGDGHGVVFLPGKDGSIVGAEIMGCMMGITIQAI